MNKTAARSAEGFIDPGGSSPLAVLGHVEAAMELARQVARRSCPMEGPPDSVFLPIGTGGTAMGLVLGFYLLGWPTRVVATCSQDKSLLAKLVVNGDIIEPFDIAHAKHLLAESMPWAKKLGLVGDSITPADILKDRFALRQRNLAPRLRQDVAQVAEGARIARERGLVLDGTFRPRRSTR